MKYARKIKSTIYNGTSHAFDIDVDIRWRDTAITCDTSDTTYKWYIVDVLQSHNGVDRDRIYVSVPYY